MYHITKTRVNNLKPLDWIMRDVVLLPEEGRIIFGVKKYPMAFDVQLVEVGEIDKPDDDRYLEGEFS